MEITPIPKVQIVPAQPNPYNPTKTISNNISDLQKNLPGFPIEVSQENISPQNQKHALNYYYLLNGRNKQYANLLQGIKYFLEESKKVDFNKLQFPYNGTVISGNKVVDLLIDTLHFFRGFPPAGFGKDVSEILEKHLTGEYPPKQVWK